MNYSFKRSVVGKSKNRRIDINLLENEVDQVILVRTKTLTSRKNRDIYNTEQVYSIEAFCLLNKLSDEFLTKAEVQQVLNQKQVIDLQIINVTYF